ncbi:MAG TPA: hemolysin [Synergistaceae bacterium]|jgi:hemolysin III|uniref:PAQR family membrane homeostasis protein TrhA n=1 Tax=Synergistaceae TaxID=649777 RepID=UPI000EDBEFA9|nr:hemolysin III family protein [Synergistaceae bacterium DZ-S4]HAH69930.1 hemolysin [Synergistaceae bacterium]
MGKFFREPASGLSHLAGALLSVAGLILLLYAAITNRDVWQIVSFSIFGASMILLYSASAAYHLVNASEKAIRILQKIDHSMIFVLIAGTYTPICLTLLRGRLGYWLLALIWSCAAAGIVMKMFFFDIPRLLYTGVYLIMGWIAVFVIVPLYRAGGPLPLIWLLAGGLFYTAGGIIYAIKKPNILPGWLGFHELFHIFVILGSTAHYVMILRFC